MPAPARRPRDRCSFSSPGATLRKKDPARRKVNPARRKKKFISPCGPAALSACDPRVRSLLRPPQAEPTGVARHAHTRLCACRIYHVLSALDRLFLRGSAAGADFLRICRESLAQTRSPAPYRSCRPRGHALIFLGYMPFAGAKPRWISCYNSALAAADGLWTSAVPPIWMERSGPTMPKHLCAHGIRPMSWAAINGLWTARTRTTGTTSLCKS